MPRPRSFAPAVLAAVAFACAPHTNEPLDAGASDAGPADAGETDAGPADAGETDAGFDCVRDDECDAPELCRNTKCVAPASCFPGELACDRKERTRCRADGTAAETLESCEAGCADGACLPCECTTGTARCRGAIGEQCVACRWLVEKICSDGPCAVVGSATRCGLCECVIGYSRCEDADTVAECDDCFSYKPRECDPGKTCLGESCVPFPCAVGDVRCVNRVQQKCLANRRGWEDVRACAANEICVGATCRTPCNPGERRCAPGNDLVETCNAAGQDWEFTATCRNGCVAAACTPCTCEDGLRECGAVVGGRVQLRVCACSGFVAAGACAADETCAAGACVLPTPCAPGARRCDLDDIRECNAAGTAWLVRQECAGSCDTITKVCQ